MVDTHKRFHIKKIMLQSLGWGWTKEVGLFIIERQDRSRKIHLSM